MLIETCSFTCEIQLIFSIYNAQTKNGFVQFKKDGYNNSLLAHQNF